MYQLIILFIINFSFQLNVNADHNNKLRLIQSWKSLDFAFPNAEARQKAINKGEFIPGGPVPLDFAVIPNQGHKAGKTLITVPRFQLGVPVTLGYITNKYSRNNSRLIAPYPNWEMNKLDNDCNHIVSVYRTAIDECNRLWVLDTGLLVLNRLCPPKLLVFDLSNDELISTYEFPSDQFHNNTLPIQPIVDIRNGQCDKAFVYMADTVTFQLLVYDHENKRSWNIQNILFDAEKEYVNTTILGEVITRFDGIFSVTLSPLHCDDRLLYFHSLASLKENYVRASIVRNWELFRGNPNASSQSFHKFSYERPSQSSIEVMDKNGMLFYPLLPETALACWNSKIDKNFSENSVDIVVQNSETLQFPSSMKIISIEGQRDQLWLLTMRFQKLMAGTLNPNETNFRILGGYVDELVHGTKCEKIVRHNSH